MFCTKCGSPAQQGARFCRNCGQPLGMGAETPQVAPPPSNLETAPPPPPAPAPAFDAPAAAYTPPVAALNVTPLPAPFAGFWLRLVAYLIDSVLMAIAFGVIVAIAIATLGVRFFRGLAPSIYDRPPNPFFPAATLGVILVLLPVTIAVTWLYFASMESSPRQATLGKMALGLFVTDLDGRPVTFGRASGRFFAKMITGLIPFFIGYIMAGFTQKKQALHDMIAGCLVLKKV
jgi:uncharacterized RDD family membrane protein YckC